MVFSAMDGVAIRHPVAEKFWGLQMAGRRISTLPAGLIIGLIVALAGFLSFGYAPDAKAQSTGYQPGAVRQIVMGSPGSTPYQGLSTARMSERALSYVGCVDIRGLQVTAVANSQVQDVARAYIDPVSRQPMVIYNPEVLAQLQSATRLFFFVHECAHHVIGHALGFATPGTMEQEADCWAVNRLQATGLLGMDEIRTIQGDIIRFGRGDLTHLPGGRRAVNLLSCLNDAGQVGLTGSFRPVGTISGGVGGRRNFAY